MQQDSKNMVLSCSNNYLVWQEAGHSLEFVQKLVLLTRLSRHSLHSYQIEEIDWAKWFVLWCKISSVNILILFGTALYFVVLHLHIHIQKWPIEGFHSTGAHLLSYGDYCSHGGEYLGSNLGNMSPCDAQNSCVTWRLKKSFLTNDFFNKGIKQKLFMWLHVNSEKGGAQSI